MKRLSLLFILSVAVLYAFAQPTTDATLPQSSPELIIEKLNGATAVKNQQNTGTCWCFSGTSLVESQFLKGSKQEVDLSEMFTVRNIYLEKAKNYYLRQGHAQFSEGGLGHDVIRAISLYGAMPETVFKGLPEGQKYFDHGKLVSELKNYLDSAIARVSRGDREAANTLHSGVEDILTKYIGNPPAEFAYNGKNYTPKSFATDYLKFNADDFVNITSFTDHPYYNPFVISVPDNFSNGAYYNLPLNEMTDLTKSALKSGYTILWDADVSNSGFAQNRGVALNVAKGTVITAEDAFKKNEEAVSPEIRQKLFEDLVTQDDHLMHIIGLEKTKDGETFFMVKNSWGATGPYKGYINVSEPYFDINTISLVVPKAALSKAMLDKLHIK